MKKILPALICVSIVCLMFAWAFTATPTAESDSSTTEADSSTTEEPGSLYYEETLRFNGVDLIKKDVPGWLINAIEEDDPIVVARTIAKKNPKDFKVRRIFNKDETGFYCFHEGYIRKEGGIISVANGEIRIDLDEPTVNLAIPEEPSFEFVKALINLLWEREGKSFWTDKYEHYVQIKEMPFPYEGHKERSVCIDGEFLSLMPDTYTPLPEEKTYDYADENLTRSKIWVNDDSFYCVKSFDFQIYTWEWGDQPEWVGTCEVPTLDDVVVAEGRNGRYCWYLINRGNEVTVFEPSEPPETTSSFVLEEVIRINFNGAEMVRPFAGYQGPETPMFAYVAVPEKNTVWKIAPYEISVCQLEETEITTNRVFARDGRSVEVLATAGDDWWRGGSWFGNYCQMIDDLRFVNLVNFEGGYSRFTIADEVTTEFREEEIILETEDVCISISQ